MLRLGLCCLFRDEPIRFRTTTARVLRAMAREDRLAKLSEICAFNAESLAAALETAARLGIGAFRVTSGFFPRVTHPEVGYALADLPEAAAIDGTLRRVRDLREALGLRLSFHPDPFVVLSSPDRSVVRRSVAELRSHGRLAERIGAEVINVHGGGAYGDKAAALKRFRRVVETLPDAVRRRLTVENDDRVYAPADLLPLCRDLAIPLVYDVHHHRCLPDALSVEAATEAAAQTWLRLGREPYFHVSSPRNGWGEGDPKPHADFVDPQDVPPCWLGLDATVDVEAKAKELAVLRLRSALARGGAPAASGRRRGAVARGSRAATRA